MAQKPKFSRKKKKERKRKKISSNKDEDVKNFSKNDASLTLRQDSPQNFESPNSAFDEEKTRGTMIQYRKVASRHKSN